MAKDILEVLGIGPATSDEKPRPAMFANPFSFNGRIRRTEYGISYILYIIIYLANMGLVINEYREPSNPVIFLLIMIPAFWFLLAQGAKRCHDVGHSGWYQLIPFYVLWMLFQDGQRGTNEYGENPKGIPGDTDLSF